MKTPEDNNNKNKEVDQEPSQDVLLEPSEDSTGMSTPSLQNKHRSDSIRVPARDPFLAFVPHVARWASSIMGREATSAKNAVIGFPSWSVDYVGGTVSYYREHPRILFKEILSGFTVAIMQVPDTIAFSFVAGVPPLSGLQVTFWMALITGIFGGKQGMISGEY